MVIIEILRIYYVVIEVEDVIYSHIRLISIFFMSAYFWVFKETKASFPKDLIQMFEVTQENNI